MYGLLRHHYILEGMSTWTLRESRGQSGTCAGILWRGLRLGRPERQAVKFIFVSWRANQYRTSVYAGVPAHLHVISCICCRCVCIHIYIYTCIRIHTHTHTDTHGAYMPLSTPWAFHSPYQGLGHVGDGLGFRA